jgi:hypothetical protein
MILKLLEAEIKTWYLGNGKAYGVGLYTNF